MYQNPGATIKRLGKVLFIVGVIISCYFGIYGIVIGAYVGQKNGFAGFITGLITTSTIIGLGAFISYIANVFTVAYGELVESNMAIKNSLEKLIAQNGGEQGSRQNDILPKSISDNSANTEKSIPVRRVKPETSSGFKKCSICGTKNPINVFTCSQCGFGLSNEIEYSSASDSENKESTSKKAPSNSYWFCTKCGNENVSGIYCTQCGKRKEN